MQVRTLFRALTAAPCAAAVLAFAGSLAFAGERFLLPPDTPKPKIVNMNPSEVDPSLLPLDSVEILNTAGGTPPVVDIETWRLSVKGKKTRNAFSLAYEELAGMEQVKKRVILLFLALKVNGLVLPGEHGFPARLVAEDILGGSWVKWVKSIEVE
jgi:DMSO/TMAO reductase YedYZ molybdopterin-dependent catalytic subunit